MLRYLLIVATGQFANKLKGGSLVQLIYPPLPPETSSRFEYPIPPSKQEIILERIGFTTTSWDQMNWYVAFVRENLSRLTTGDFLNLQEQVTAIWYKLRYIDQKGEQPRRPQPLPTTTEIKLLQDIIAQHLSDIADKGASRSSPYTVTRFIEHLHFWDEDHENGEYDFWRSQVFISGKQENAYKEYLVNHLFDLLREHAQSIRRCPHCSRVFLQLRRHAMYCSRACQSVATMKKHRTNEPQKEAATRKSGKPSRTRSKRKEGR
jgi:hypothetical protein